MARINLEKLSIRELTKLADDVAAAVVARKEQEREAAKAKLVEVASASGFSLEELFGKVHGRKTRGKVAPKYRNPDDPTQTWAGRGRQPLWLAAALKKNGAKLEKFLIK